MLISWQTFSLTCDAIHFSDKKYHGIIAVTIYFKVLGCGSFASFTMLESFIYFKLSYIATTSSTVDRELFPTLFRVNQILDDLNPLRIKMMQYFNWTRVATIFVQDDTSTSVSYSIFEINIPITKTCPCNIQSFLSCKE